MKKLLAIIVLGLMLVGCATGNQTIKVENKILAPKIIAIDANAGPWMGEIIKRIKNAGFKVIMGAIAGERTNINKDNEFKSKEAKTQYILYVNASAPTDFMNRCMFGGYNFSYIFADLIDTNTGETIASIESKGHSEGCAPLEGSIFKNITKMVSESWHPRMENLSGSTELADQLTEEKAIKKYLSNRKLDTIEGIWGSGRSRILIKKNNNSFDLITLKSSTGNTKNGQKFATIKTVSENNYTGQGIYFRRDKAGAKFTCKTEIQLLDINSHSRVCTPDIKEYKPVRNIVYRLWPENFESHNNSVSK